MTTDGHNSGATTDLEPSTDMEARTGIDVNFRFTEDTPPGKDPDQHSPTLRRYHQRLWSKPLPDGTIFSLEPTANDYLLHVSSLGTFSLTSDAITTPLAGRAWRVIGQIPAAQRPKDLGYRQRSPIPGESGGWERDFQYRPRVPSQDRGPP